MTNKNEWFGEWFNSPYYHILYKNHDRKEAQVFIDNLINYIQFDQGKKILDVACGRGRHSIYLNKKGFNVTGIDLSVRNTEMASSYKNPGLHFFVHDMRKPFTSNEFDLAINVFTSFGFFESKEEDFKTINNISEALIDKGKFLLDFFNPKIIEQKGNSQEEKKSGGIKFNIVKEILDGSILKDIKFEEKNKLYHFHEKVRLIQKEQFLEYFAAANLRLIKIFGNYGFEEFHQDTSERMIFLTEKNVR